MVTIYYYSVYSNPLVCGKGGILTKLPVHKAEISGEISLEESDWIPWFNEENFESTSEEATCALDSEARSKLNTKRNDLLSKETIQRAPIPTIDIVSSSRKTLSQSERSKSLPTES